MNKLSLERQIRVVSALVEGNSIRATVRMTGVAKNTVVKLLADLGQACAEYQDKTLRNLPCKRIQCDEIWAFVHCKAKNVKKAKAAPEGAGDAWTWTALDADTKLIVGWMIGPRDAGVAYEFMTDVAGRLTNRVQLTTDSHSAYLTAVEEGFGAGVDYAQLVKIYNDTLGRGYERRYSPANFCGTKIKVVAGDPDPDHISTSFVERQNLTMRMSMRRFTRLTNAFSKKIENLGHAVALHFMYYNFCRIHQTLKITPAMAAGVTDTLWEIKDVLALIAEPMQAAA